MVQFVSLAGVFCFFVFLSCELGSFMTHLLTWLILKMWGTEATWWITRPYSNFTIFKFRVRGWHSCWFNSSNSSWKLTLLNLKAAFICIICSCLRPCLFFPFSFAFITSNTWSNVVPFRFFLFKGRRRAWGVWWSHLAGNISYNMCYFYWKYFTRLAHIY